MPNLAKIYAEAVATGKRTIESVPAPIRVEVQSIIEANK